MRWLPLAATAAVFWRTRVLFRSWRSHRWMPLLPGHFLVALFIWLAENIATFAGAWTCPDQAAGWQMVGLAKLGSWFLLMQFSFVLVSLVSPISGPEDAADEETFA